MGAIMFETISEEAAVLRCEEDLAGYLEGVADQVGDINVGYQGGNEHVEGVYIKRHDLWAACIDFGANRYWNAFGFGNPFEGPKSIVVEVNPPVAGIDRRIGGLFVADGDRVLLCHRGRVGGGRKGIGKAAFFEFWTGETIDVHDGDRISTVIPVTTLGTDSLCDDIAAFVNVVKEFKEHAAANA